MGISTWEWWPSPQIQGCHPLLGRQTGLPFPGITAVLQKKRTASQSSLGSVGDNNWKAKVRCGKSRHLGCHFQAHSFVGHVYWWAAYFTDFSIGNWCCPFVSVRKQRQEGSPPPSPLSTCTTLSTLQVSVQLSPPVKGHPWPGLHPFPNRMNHTLSVQHFSLAVEKLLQRFSFFISRRTCFTNVTQEKYITWKTTSTVIKCMPGI